jgi:hypothetical protein
VEKQPTPDADRKASGLRTFDSRRKASSLRASHQRREASEPGWRARREVLSQGGANYAEFALGSGRHCTIKATNGTFLPEGFEPPSI